MRYILTSIVGGVAAVAVLLLAQLSIAEQSQSPRPIFSISNHHITEGHPVQVVDLRPVIQAAHFEHLRLLGGSSMPQNNRAAIESVKGTIYFIKENEALKQGFDMTINNHGSPFAGQVNVKWEGKEVLCDIGSITSGQSVSRIYVPDVRIPVKMTFSLEGSELTIDHKPQRHWTVHVVNLSHHDLGYTNIPTNVLKEYCSYYDDILQFCRETDDYPEDSKYRYSVEQGWSLLHWLDNRPQEVCDEMIRRIKEGRLEVNAFLGNEITELCGPEEMVRLLYPVFELKRKYGISVTSAEHNDIPGVSWGAAAALVGAGIKYFNAGLADYFRADPEIRDYWDSDIVVPGNRPHAFYWQAPNGGKVLFWHHPKGVGGDPDVTLKGLPQHLEDLQNEGYPYDVVRYLAIGGRTDNTPPKVEFAHTIKAWNSKWAYPRYVMSLSSKFWPELKAQLGDDVPTWRGVLPDTDYSIGANASASASSLNRVTHDQLLSAERFAAAAESLTPYEYPAELIDEAYYCTLMNDEHTCGYDYPSGPGQEVSVIHYSEYAHRAAALSHDVLTKSVNEIADHIQLDSDGYYAVVFNPLDQPRTDVVTAPGSPIRPCSHILKPGREHPVDENGVPAPYEAYPVSNRWMVNIPLRLLKSGFDVIDAATGKVIPHEVHQLVDPLEPSPYAPYRYSMGGINRGERLEVSFVAEDVPAMGWKLYRFVPSQGGGIANPTPSLGANPTPSLEANSTPSVEVNSVLSKEVDPTHTQSVIQVGSNTIENRFYKVELDEATGAIKSIFDKELKRELIDKNSGRGVNQIIIRSSITAEVSTTGNVTIKQGRLGPVSGSLVIKSSALGIPEIVQEIILYSEIKRIDIANRILKNSAPLLEVFFAFPFAFDKPEFRYEGPLCVVEPFVDQFPGSNTFHYAIQHWADVSDSKCGVTLSSLDAPVMQFGDNWPLYVSPAHHGYRPPGFENPLPTKNDINKGHMYSLALVNNYRTNFSPAQSGDLLFRYSITSHAGDWKEGRAGDFGYRVSLPLAHASVNGPQEGKLPACGGFFEIDKPNVRLLTIKRAQDGNGLIVRLLETEGKDSEVTIKLPYISIEKAIRTNLVEEDSDPLPSTEHTVKVSIHEWDSTTIRVIPH